MLCVLTEKFTFKVMEPVPYEATDCITVIKESQKDKGEIQQPHFRCGLTTGVDNAKAIIYVYNSVYNSTNGIGEFFPALCSDDIYCVCMCVCLTDIIAMPNAGDATMPIQFIAQGLTLGGSSTANLDAKQYAVKVRHHSHSN